MARDFPGSGPGLVSIGDVTALQITGTALTIAAWIRPDVVGTVFRTIARKSAGNDGYILDVSTTTKLRAVIGDGAGVDSVEGATTIGTGTWQHAALRKNGTGAGALAVFVNGASDGSTTSNRSLSNAAGIAFTVGDIGAGGTGFDGRIGELAVWNVALTDAELAALAKGTSPLLVRPANLKGYWPLWAVAYPEADLSGNVNNGSQTGTVNAADHAPVGPLVRAVA